MPKQNIKKPDTDRTVKEKLQNSVTSARWVVKTAWKIAPRLMLSSCILLLIQSIFPALVAWVGRNMINVIVNAASGKITSFTPIANWIALSLLIALIQEVLSNTAAYINFHFQQRVGITIDVEVLRHASKLDLNHFEDPEYQDLMERARNNISSNITGFLLALMNFFAAMFQLITISGVLVVIDPVALLIALPVGVPFIWFRLHFAQLKYQVFYNRTTRRRWLNYFSGKLMGKEVVAEVKLYGLGPLLINRFAGINMQFKEEDRRLYRSQLAGNFFFDIVFVIVSTGILAYQAAKVLRRVLQVGDMIIYSRMMGQLQTVIQQFASTGSQMIENSLYVSDYMRYINTVPAIVSGVGLVPVEESLGEVELRDVTFTYPGSSKPSISNVSLHIRPGETIAIVGENGAGKTTLMKLLTRLYDLDSGEILFNGRNIRDLELTYLHSQIAYVPQSFSRYEATIGDNIAYGDWQRLMDDPEEVQAIARRTQLSDLIETMPEGYNTLLGRLFGTFDLSGGQWQRVAISRAFARNSSFLILDEPTSNLDARKEYNLFSQFRQLTQGRTAILISHRFSTVSIADRIVVLNNGRIVEMGTHAELLSKDGQYADLYHLHQKQYQIV